MFGWLYELRRAEVKIMGLAFLGIAIFVCAGVPGVEYAVAAAGCLLVGLSTVGSILPQGIADLSLFLHDEVTTASLRWMVGRARGRQAECDAAFESLDHVLAQWDVEQVAAAMTREQAAVWMAFVISRQPGSLIPGSPYTVLWRRAWHLTRQVRAEH